MMSIADIIASEARLSKKRRVAQLELETARHCLWTQLTCVKAVGNKRDDASEVWILTKWTRQCMCECEWKPRGSGNGVTWRRRAGTSLMSVRRERSSATRSTAADSHTCCTQRAPSGMWAVPWDEAQARERRRVLWESWTRRRRTGEYREHLLRERRHCHHVELIDVLLWKREK